jgi:light-regulated signal transduction histidine kinase (bacteriophytochrome)
LSEKFEGNLDEEGEDFLRRICDSAVMMSTLIDDLLKLSRVTMSELKIELVNLSELFMSVCDEKVKEEPGRRVEILVKENLYAECDASLMRICLTNLFENAWKFTSKADKPVIQFGEEMSNGRMCFFIRDNGVGFEMEHVDKLFGAFQRLHSSTEFDGTGIGLAIVKRAINKHRGSIWAESKKDEGAVFYFVLNN